MKALKIGMTLLLLVATLTLGTSCKQQEQKKAQAAIEKAVDEMNLPVEIKKGYELTDITYKNNLLTYEITIPKKDLKNLKETELKDNTMKRLITGLFPRRLVEQLVKADAKVHYIFKSGYDYIDFEFGADELVEDD